MAEQNVLRLIGIDFGTSTSLIRVKRYQGSQPIGDSYNTSSVTYGNGAGDSKAVTLVRHNGDGTFTCGRYGEDETPGSTIYREFKMDLENPDLEKQGLAKELTGEFFKYLFSRYEHQESDLGQASDTVQTLISYPAKWKKESRAFMEEAARDAGFPNVSSMDEPSAALYAVLCRKMDEITKQGLLKAGQSGYVLLIDMGAGTTDLAVCSYEISDAEGELMAADRIKTSVVSTWPNDSSSLTFGGREVDRILEDYLVAYLRDVGMPDMMADKVVRGNPAVKAWKEDTVSTLLAQNQDVNYCSCTSNYAMLFGQKPFPAFGREKFQQMLAEKLEEFKQLVNGCLDAAIGTEPALAEKGIDLVVLTGGHSSWYFTSELMDGTMPGVAHSTLQKVQQEENRVMRLSNPQETVALGMVYSQLPFQVAMPEPEPEPEPEPVPIPIPAGPDQPEPIAREFNIEELGEFIRNYPFTAHTPAAEDKIALLRAYLKVPHEATVYRAFDATVFGSCKNGTVFTDKGIYSRSTWGNPMLCTWQELAEGFVRTSGSQLYLVSTQVGGEKLIGAFISVDDEFRSFYNSLQERLRSGRNSCDKPNVTAPEPTDYSGVDFEMVLRSVLSSTDPGMLALLTEKSVVSTMRAYLNVPAHETVYLAHDDTLFKSGKNGTLLTGSGIYSRSLWESAVYTTWQQFAAGKIISESADIYLEIPGDTLKRKIGYFSSYMPAAVKLYLSLQQAFRDAASGAQPVTKPAAPAAVQQPHAVPAGDLIRVLQNAVSPVQPRENKIPETTGMPVREKQCSASVEEFLKIYDWSGMKELFDPAHIAAVRAEAQPLVGEVYMAHKGYDTGDGGKTWFWFALGERGICNDAKQFISWSEFVRTGIVYNKRFNQQDTLTDTGSVMLELNGNVCCELGSMRIPSAGWLVSAQFAMFFRELQQYMQSPDDYPAAEWKWNTERDAALRNFPTVKPYIGVLGKCSAMDPRLREYLGVPDSSEPLYLYQSHNPSSIFNNACCIDQRGFRSRYTKHGKVRYTSLEQFVNSRFWAVRRDNLCCFFAGNHLLFELRNASTQFQACYYDLLLLQNRLRNGQ